MTRRTMTSGGFSEVDAAERPDDLVEYLDAVRRQEAMARLKQASFQFLRLKPGDTALDVGCGTGEDVQALRELVGPNGRSLGVDPSATMLSRARSRVRGENVEFLQGRAQDLPLPDASVDGCRCERVLQHLPDPEVAVAEMARVLRPGGRVVLMEPDWESLLIDIDPELDTIFRTELMRGTVSPRVGRSLGRLLAKAGLEEREVLPVVIQIEALATFDVLLSFWPGLLADSIAQGGMTNDQAERWRRALEDADSAGHFSAVTLGFTAMGTKPG